FAATALVAPVQRVNRADEGWMLWVMDRVAHGDVLYRDVYDVTTPLPAWFGAAVVDVTGSELMVLRLLVAAVVAAMVVTACSIARRAGMQWRGQIVLAVALIACASPMLVFMSFYTACAVLGALLALRALQWLLDRSERGAGTVPPLVWIGVATALSFWCKPNIGLLALAAVVVTLAVDGGRAWRTSARAGGIVLGVFAAVGVVLSTILAATGAWSAFVDQVFREKREYLDVGFSFATAVERRGDALTSVDPIDTRAIVWLLVLATPVVVAAALGWACWRARRHLDARLVGFVGFGVVGILGAVPRPGVDHLGSTLPLMVTAAAGAVLSVPEYGPPQRARRGLLVASAALAGVAALIVAGAALDTPSSAKLVTDAPYFSGVPVPRVVATRAKRLKAGLAEHTDGEVFFVRRDAGFLHFLTGTHNPLPYDIAERSDFGSAGEAGVIRRLRNGAAPWVCLEPARIKRDGTDPLVPRALERWVRANGELTALLPMCDLYRLASR
ncbi:MAG: hypothetical protein ACHQIG_06770, partial [Acidimicrobiia bacterium]